MDDDEREEELETLSSIYPEMVRHPEQQYQATLELAIKLSRPLRVRFLPEVCSDDISYAGVAAQSDALGGQDVELSHLPPLCLDIALPTGYPTDAPPLVALSTRDNCLPPSKLAGLEHEVVHLWEEYGRSIILFVYIDHLQQVAERGFDLDQLPDARLILPVSLKSRLVTFDEATKLATFNAGTFECGICLDPKKGSLCYRMMGCGHVYCLNCLQEFYNHAITEGDVANVLCLSPDCETAKHNPERALQPRELLAMGIEDRTVRRYVEMKRKKKLEADKSTVYCPRTWCQGPARSPKYPPIPADISTYVLHESAVAEAGEIAPKPPNPAVQPDPSDRLAVCEACSLAFCRVCYMGWHGPFARCFPRDPKELSAEEKASYDYIRLHTSPCPTCSSPTSKTMGCNHMSCFQCKSHFCYLCGSWLDGSNPYQHFNKPGTECYQRLWELEEGDNGRVPDDGRGFAGGRGWEQIAMDVAREADAQDAANEAAAQAIQVEEDALAAEALGAPLRQVPIIVQHMAQLDLAHRRGDEAPVAAPRPAPRAGRRPQHPFPMRPPAAAGLPVAQAVRNHERNRNRRDHGPGIGGAGMPNGRAGALAAGGLPPRHRVPRPPPNQAVRPDDADRQQQQQEIQRFLEMAQRDEEDGWDSDELGDDETYQIR